MSSNHQKKCVVLTPNGPSNNKYQTQKHKFNYRSQLWILSILPKVGLTMRRQQCRKLMIAIN